MLTSLLLQAGCVIGWEKFSHLAVGMLDRYGASGPLKSVYEKFGFTKENVAAQAKNLLAFYDGKPVPSLVDRPINSYDYKQSRFPAH